MSSNKSTTPITRFAPSPTGFLHIGGARTALFNWLYAKANGGKMLLRIEDTDRKRSTDEATKAILDGLNWLGLDWEGEPVSQFSRAQRHREVALEMVASNNAYYCYASPEELDKMRARSRETGEPMIYQWRDRDAGDAPGDRPGVIRLKSPQEGKTVVRDGVQGDVAFANKDLDDMILLRSDGSPTYMHAVVVDDHDMGVTHIIRGDDHLTNAARQMLVYQAMGWDVPVMAHIPLIHGPDGAKLSKRHGAMGVDGYRAMGYLPQAVRNYLVRLGWSHGDDEIMSMAQMTEWFDISGIGKGASRFDFTKLEHLNAHYIRNSENDDLASQLLENAKFLPDTEHLEQLDEKGRNTLVAVMPLIKEKAKTLIDLATSSAFAFSERPVVLDEKAIKILNDDARHYLSALLPMLEKVTQWDHENLGNCVRDFCENQDIKLGKIAQPIRCAIAGTPSAPGVFEVMAFFGKEEVLARISDQSHV